MIFVADRIPHELRRIVEFLNQQMDPAEVLAVELRQYTAGETTKWTEPAFFEALAKVDASTVPVARAILEWGVRNGARFWWGEGTTQGSFFPVIDANGASYQIIGVWSYATVEIQFQWLLRKPEFADDSVRQELAARQSAIVPNSIPIDAIRRRPSIPLAAFRDLRKLEALLSVLDWTVERIRGGAGRGGL